MESLRIFPNGAIFHICNKSIANFRIFRNEKLLERFLITLKYYNNDELKISLSRALREQLDLDDLLIRKATDIVSVIAYCIMPDHYHLLIKIQRNHLFSKYINNIESSYTRFYNKKYVRKGPLWQSRFRAVRLIDDYTLLHVHRYIHLNPTTAGLVKKPEDWEWSSYSLYITKPIILPMNKEIRIASIKRYKLFVEDQINYQKTIKGIRRSFLE